MGGSRENVSHMVDSRVHYGPQSSNLDGATAAEVRTLTDLSRSTVLRETGYDLEPKIRFVG